MPRWAALFAFVLALAACAKLDVAEPTSVETRWGDGAWTATTIHHLMIVEPHGETDFWMRYARPRGATSVYVNAWEGLADVSIGGHRVFDEHRRAMVTSLPPGDDPVVLHYRVNEPIHVYAVTFGSEDSLAEMIFRDDAGSIISGVVLFVVGVIALGVTMLSRRRGAPLMWLAAFSVASGAVQFGQSAAVRMLVVPSGSFWRAVSVAGIAAYVSTFSMLVDTLFRLRDRLLHAVAIASSVIVVVWLALTLTPNPHTNVVRTLLYCAAFVALVDIAIRISKRVRQDATARYFAVGFAGLVACALPDMIWGLGVQLLPFNTGYLGTIFFAAVVALILQRNVDRNLTKLEAHTAQVRRLNAELRRQIAQRSREISRLVTAANLDGATALHPGAQLGPYTLRDRLGEGGMGTVYRAERTTDTGVEVVALKVMAGGIAPEDAMRFTREAELASQLDHENLVSVLDVGYSGSTLYLVMQLIDGPSLEDMRHRFGDVALMLPILEQVVRGLVALHAAGIVHRDLKPPNVLSTKSDGRLLAKISDFGISRRVDDPQQQVSVATTMPHITKAGVIVGTPLYMAPEAMRGEVDARGDIFALGVMAYEMLTSARPFRVPPGLAVVVTGSLPPPPSLEALGLVPPALAAVLDRCIAQDPSSRPTAAEILDVMVTR